MPKFDVKALGATGSATDCSTYSVCCAIYQLCRLFAGSSICWVIYLLDHLFAGSSIWKVWNTYFSFKFLLL